MHKAVFIDVKKGEVREVEIDDGLDKIYELIGCRSITVALDLGEGHAVFVDDEGYLNGTQDFFKFKEIDTQWFAGNGLIIAEKGEDYIDHKIDVEKLQEAILFMNCDDEKSCPKLPPPQIFSW